MANLYRAMFHVIDLGFSKIDGTLKVQIVLLIYTI